MSCVVSEATKLAAAEPAPQGGNVAVSLRLSWAQVAKIVDNIVPLRRPNRTTPAPTLKQEIAAWDAASDESWDAIDD
jgi:hypothetical protein